MGGGGVAPMGRAAPRTSTPCEALDGIKRSPRYGSGSAPAGASGGPELAPRAATEPGKDDPAGHLPALPPVRPEGHPSRLLQGAAELPAVRGELQPRRRRRRGLDDREPRGDDGGLLLLGLPRTRDHLAQRALDRAHRVHDRVERHRAVRAGAVLPDRVGGDLPVTPPYGRADGRPRLLAA